MMRRVELNTRVNLSMSVNYLRNLAHTGIVAILERERTLKLLAPEKIDTKRAGDINKRNLHTVKHSTANLFSLSYDMTQSNVIL